MLDFASTLLRSFGGKGIRTPDFQLAKLALYQLSYAPERPSRTGDNCRSKIADCNGTRERWSRLITPEIRDLRPKKVHPECEHQQKKYLVGPGSRCVRLERFATRSASESLLATCRIKDGEKKTAEMPGNSANGPAVK